MGFPALYPTPYNVPSRGYAKGWRRINTSAAIKNNNGVVFGGGNVVATNPITTTVAIVPSNTKKGVIVPNLGGRVGTTTSFAAGTFCGQKVDNYIVKGGSHMQFLAGVANTKLNTPTRVSVFNKSINGLEFRTSPNIASWNLLNGQPTYNTISAIYAHFGTDNEAHPSSTTPGHLEYLATGMNPTSGTYATRYLW